MVVGSAGMEGIVPQVAILSRSLRDQDIAQVELLPGLDSKFLADLRAILAADGCGIVDDAIRRARDEDGEREPAAGIGGRAVLVVDRIYEAQVILVGREDA